MATKAEKRQLIVQTARETFLKEGLISTSMDRISEKSGLSRRTLYRYFDKKEDLAFEVTTGLLREWNQFYHTTFLSVTGSGIEKLNAFLYELITYMSNKIEVMHYLGEFDFFFQDTSIDTASETQLDEFNDVILESDDYIISLLIEGMNDGSIDGSIDVKLTESTISNVLWSFGQRVANRSKIIKKETGFEAIELVKHQVDLYIKALKK